MATKKASKRSTRSDFPAHGHEDETDNESGDGETATPADEGSLIFSTDQERLKHFPQLRSVLYVDHAGAALPSRQVIDAVHQDLLTSPYANPHSVGPAASLTASRIQDVRRHVLRTLFNVTPDDYTLVFTAGATAAMKMVGELFPWQEGSECAYLLGSHNSLVGVREYALAKGATFRCYDDNCFRVGACGSPFTRESFKRNNGTTGLPKFQPAPDVGSDSRLPNQCSPVRSLFLFPGECNATGVKYDISKALHSAKRANEGLSQSRWYTLLDASKLVATSPVDLRLHRPDFVAMSFYKVFGFPTGLGCLLIRRGCEPILCDQKKYFGGGTVRAAFPRSNMHEFKENDAAAMLEDGSVDFIGIVSLRHGLKALRQLGGMRRIQLHASILADMFQRALTGLRHGNGLRVAEVYGNWERSSEASAGLQRRNLCHQGPVVAFNLLDARGAFIGCFELEKIAAAHHVQLRTGCFCNPGACARHLGLSEADLQSAFEDGHVCGDTMDVHHGKPTGAVRVSFGWSNIPSDVDTLIRIIQSYFVEAVQSEASGESADSQEVAAVADVLSASSTPTAFPASSQPLTQTFDARAESPPTRRPSDFPRPTAGTATMTQRPRARSRLQNHSFNNDASLNRPQQHPGSTKKTNRDSGLLPHAIRVEYVGSANWQKFLQEFTGIFELQMRKGSTPTWKRRGSEVFLCLTQAPLTQRWRIGYNDVLTSGACVLKGDLDCKLPIDCKRWEAFRRSRWRYLSGLSVTTVPEKNATKRSHAGEGRNLCTSADPVVHQRKSECTPDIATPAIEKPVSPGNRAMTVTELWLYPIKSCAGQRIRKSWPFDPSRGFLHDRRWAIMDSASGTIITQKMRACMAQLVPELVVDELASGTTNFAVSSLLLKAPGMHVLKIDLTSQLHSRGSSDVGKASVARVCAPSAKLCGAAHKVRPFSDPEGVIGAWLLQFFAQNASSGQLASASVNQYQLVEMPLQGEKGNFANDGAYLLISQSDVDALSLRLEELHSRSGSDGLVGGRAVANSAAVVTSASFRPNIVVGGSRAFAEDTWAELRLGGVNNVFRVSKPCARCAMINIDQQTKDSSAQNLERPNSAALADPRIFATLAKFRRRNGKVHFGQYVQFGGTAPEDGSLLRLDVGARVFVTKFRPSDPNKMAHAVPRKRKAGESDAQTHTTEAAINTPVAKASRWTESCVIC